MTSICISFFSITSDESSRLDRVKYCCAKLKGILGGTLKMTAITKVQNCSNSPVEGMLLMFGRASGATALDMQANYLTEFEEFLHERHMTTTH